MSAIYSTSVESVHNAADALAQVSWQPGDGAFNDAVEEARSAVANVQRLVRLRQAQWDRAVACG